MKRLIVIAILVLGCASSAYADDYGKTKPADRAAASPPPSSLCSRGGIAPRGARARDRAARVRLGATRPPGARY